MKLNSPPPYPHFMHGLVQNANPPLAIRPKKQFSPFSRRAALHNDPSEGRQRGETAPDGRMDKAGAGERASALSLSLARTHVE